MKLLFALAATLLAAQTTLASQARLQSLQGAKFLRDSQTIFENPAHIHSLGRFVTYEFGDNSTNAATKGEGGLLMDYGTNTKAGVYLGHQDATQAALRSFNPSFLLPSNPVEIFYGKNNWGTSVYFSRNSEDQLKKNQLTVGGRFGMIQGATEYFGSIDLYASAENETAKEEFKTLPLINLGAEHEMGQYYFFGKVKWGLGEIEQAGVDRDIDVYGAEVGVLDRRFKTAGRDLYFGASLEYDQVDVANGRKSSLKLPVVIGLELDVADWIVARASIKQNVLVGFDRNTIAASAKKTNTNDTTVSSGVGFKYKGIVLDGVVAASSTGDINGNNVLTSAALTYNF